MNNKYETEAQKNWGNTAAYNEYTEKTKNYTKEKWEQANNGLMGIFVEFAECKSSAASAHSDAAQALVKKLKLHITENYYVCTDDILAGLGQMYICDERFKKNIDKYGDGTAEFAAEAIACFCK